MGLTVTIDGASVPIAPRSLNVNDVVAERSTASFTVPDPTWIYGFEQDDPVVITAPSGDRLFGGFIDTVERNRNSYTHVVQCKDGHSLVDRHLVAAGYRNRTAGYIIADIWTNLLEAEGITVGRIDNGPTISEAAFGYVRASDAIGSICDQAGFWWRIDPNFKLWAVAKGTIAAPWSFTADTDGRYNTVRRKDQNQLYRNKQWIRGGQGRTSLQTENFLGDGQTRSFALGYPVAAGMFPAIGMTFPLTFPLTLQETSPAPPIVYVNGVAQTVGIKQVDTGKQWYYRHGDEVITQDPSQTAAPVGQTVEAVYTGLFDILTVSEDSSQVVSRVDRQGMGTGVVESILEDRSITSQATAFALAAAQLQLYATDGVDLVFQTQRTGLEPGQLLTVNVAEYGLSAEEMLIWKITTRDEDGLVLWQQVEAIQGPITGTWAKFFAKLVAATQGITIRQNVSANEAVIVFKSVSESWTHTETVTVTAHACPLPGSTLYPGGTLYPC